MTFSWASDSPGIPLQKPSEAAVSPSVQATSPPLISIPRALYRTLFGMLLFLGVAVIVLFGLLWAQGQTFSHENHSKDTQISQLNDRVNLLEAQLNRQGK